MSIYGSNLATSGVVANSLPLPTNLGGTSVTITDSSGATAALPLFYAGPTQINAEIPQTASTGTATLTITAPSGTQTASVMLTAVAPGLFAANQNGKGVAAAQLVTNQSNGQQTIIDIVNAPCAAGGCVGLPLDVSSGNTALVLFGTGIQNRASLSDVTVTNRKPDAACGLRRPGTRLYRPGPGERLVAGEPGRQRDGQYNGFGLWNRVKCGGGDVSVEDRSVTYGRRFVGCGPALPKETTGDNCLVDTVI